MHTFTCVFSIQYMRIHNIHINYILANFINFYDNDTLYNKLHFKNDYINITEYSKIFELYNIITNKTNSLKKITDENYKHFLNNYDIKYTHNNTSDKINYFIDICKNYENNTDFSITNNFHLNYTFMKVFLSSNIPSIKPSSLRETHIKNIINENKLYYHMFGFLYEKFMDSVYILN